MDLHTIVGQSSECMLKNALHRKTAKNTSIVIIGLEGLKSRIERQVALSRSVVGYKVKHRRLSGSCVITKTIDLSDDAPVSQVQNKYKRSNIPKKVDTQKLQKPPLSVRIDLSDKQGDRSRNLCLDQAATDSPVVK